MPAYTAQQIIDRAAAVADMHDSFVRPATWIDWLNVERRALDLFLARSGMVQVQPVTVTVSSAPYTITIPTTVVGDVVVTEPMAVVGVWEIQNGRYRPLMANNMVDFQMQDPLTGATTGHATNYQVSPVSTVPGTVTDALQINLYPRPLTGTYFCLYLVYSANIVSLTDQVSYPGGMEERMVLGLARRALIKEESDISAVDRLIAECESRVEELAWSRLLAENPTVRNVDRTARGWSRSVTYPPPLTWFWC